MVLNDWWRRRSPFFANPTYHPVGGRTSRKKSSPFKFALPEQSYVRGSIAFAQLKGNGKTKLFAYLCFELAQPVVCFVGPRAGGKPFIVNPR